MCVYVCACVCVVCAGVGVCICVYAIALAMQEEKLTMHNIFGPSTEAANTAICRPQNKSKPIPEGTKMMVLCGTQWKK